MKKTKNEPRFSYTLENGTLTTREYGAQINQCSCEDATRAEAIFKSVVRSLRGIDLDEMHAEKFDVDTMSKEELNLALYQKLRRESASLRDWLLSQSAGLALEHGCEYWIKQDILYALEEYDLESEDAAALLQRDFPLDYIYRVWERSESQHMDEIRNTIERAAKKEW